ncbi:chromate transporter [Sphingomonas oleivorans]|uniref:Chromate transporter n=1 Tax=Sphingomonas oleivorans TaxID=1735121 RepID=A0A2T5G052_9SPHN|nr:chromate efflux transporter [Sphingomonas oleivorans]PTQ12330.1 chromate transporter [Sphingomonas oleivorans]
MLALFALFLRLGLTSFGGPVAHLGYFRAELVARRRWLDDAAYADLVALCQFLPGPASSQVAFGIGLRRGGLPGGLAAWSAFTLPSFLLMTAAAHGLGLFHGSLWAGALHGLKLAAVAVVAQAVWGMAAMLAPDRARAAIACGALLLALTGNGLAQLVAIIGGALAGLRLCRAAGVSARGEMGAVPGRRAGAMALIVFALLLVATPILGAVLRSPMLTVFAAFYRSGALVFGGGHVVLPLLQATVVAPGWVSPERFLAGYGLAQALPGPLFSFAAYLGAIAAIGPGGLAGALLATAAISLPGLLILYGALPFWHGLAARPGWAAAVRGANAAVVGLLGAALYHPLWTTTILRPGDLAAAALGWMALIRWRVPPLAVVLFCTGWGMAARG